MRKNTSIVLDLCRFSYPAALGGARSARRRAALVAMGLAACGGPAIAQDDALACRYNLGAVLSEDEAVAGSLDASLAGFLDAVVRGEVTERHVSPDHQREHAFFFRAIRQIGSRRDSVSHRPTVLKAYSPGDDTFLITVAFMRPSDSGDAIYKVIEFHAYPHGGGYRFTSPFEHRTRHMRTVQIGDVRYRYRGAFDPGRAESFVAFKQRIEGLVGVPAASLDYYRFETLDALLAAYGIVYDAAKCNWLTHDLGFTDASGRVFVTGTDDERYIFEFAEAFIARHCDQNEMLFPPMVTGLAVYFGDYALSGDDLPTLKAQFRAALAANPDIDFLDEFKKGRGSSIERHFTHFVISALISEAVIEQHGFDRAIELARSGRSGEMFFERLGTLLGVREHGFHQMVLDLIGA